MYVITFVRAILEVDWLQQAAYVLAGAEDILLRIVRNGCSYLLFCFEKLFGNIGSCTWSQFHYLSV